MTESLTRLLLRLSEGGPPAILTGSEAKRHFGGGFDALLAERLIVEQAPATDWPTCRSCECGMDARPIQNYSGRLVAACPLDASMDQDLDDDDLRSFAIDVLAVVTRIARDTGLSSPEMVADGVWFLGVAPTGRAIFLAPSLAACRQPGLVPVLQARAREAPVTIVTAMLPPAERRLADAGFHSAPIQDVLRDHTDGFFGLALERLVPVSNVAPRLVLNKSARDAIVEGKAASLSPRSFKVLWLLAEAATTDGRVVTRFEIEERVWGSTVVSKQAAADAVRGLRAELGRGGRSQTGPTLILTRQTAGYQLDLRADQVLMIR